jgi:pimeloyl-ACP methyl ester carboxylesterase
LGSARTGETLRLNKTGQPLTLQLFYNDTHDLIDTLLRRFHQFKLYLVGYSWGSVPGFYIADKYPDILYAYVAISPLINQWESERLSLKMLKETMGKKAREELSQVRIPFENAEQLYYHRKWLYKCDGQKFVNLSFRKSFVQGWGVTWFDVWSKSCAINLFETLPAINCPVYFFAGANDHNTNYSFTAEYFKKVKAPKKGLFLFPNAGHGLAETHAGQFQDTIINTILTQTFNH